MDATYIKRETDRSNGSLDRSRWRIHIQGVVQGVGFRPFVSRLATLLHLGGWIQNVTSGVLVEIEGERRGLAKFVVEIEQNAPALARVVDVHVDEIMPTYSPSSSGFEILPSEQVAGRTLVSPDVTVCPDCLTELFDSGDFRFRYPFINCTNCGPRFTIIQGVPYDRPKTTMAPFVMCPVCEAEYKDPNNRRYHAQPVACAKCGPLVTFANATGENIQLGEAAFQEAVDQIQRGNIIAIRGVGGFHIVCLANNEDAVKRLRTSKLRPSKPLALMVRSVEDAKEIAEVTDIEAGVLGETEAPIVLLKKKANGLPDCVAPQNAYVGIMLPYTPLHHLLLDALQAPLVMTSGNLSGAPICIDNEEAIDSLGKFVDGFLLHNRPIVRRCDDSVVAVQEIGHRMGVQVVRRSRGFVPLPMILPKNMTLEKPILATGADLKNVSAVGCDQQVFLSSHIGDLEHPLAREEQVSAITDLETLFDVHAECIVCDLHPGYASTHVAHTMSLKRGVPLMRVQHHHAHIASCMIDAGQSEDPVVGLAFDGTGYGTDGQIWGGEVMWCHLGRFERCYHLEYLPLPGGDAAIQKPYRIALAYLKTLVPKCEVRAYLSDVDQSEVDFIATMIAGKINTPMTSSAGRLFDAVGTLLGLGRISSHEGQIAMALEDVALAAPVDVLPYPFVFEGRQIRLGKVFEGLLCDLDSKKSKPYIARRFHVTLAHLAYEAAKKVCEKYKSHRVALSGGVWQNRLLSGMVTDLLEEQGFEVLVHHSVPANDGGIALGQVAVASAMMKE